MPQLAIVADDLTGTADTGARFAAVGLATLIRLKGTMAPNADVIIVSTESRDLGESAAADAVRSALRGVVGGQGVGEPRWIYKKNATQCAARFSPLHG
jgi:D-threonate/D-erythronate kinase